MMGSKDAAHRSYFHKGFSQVDEALWHTGAATGDLEKETRDEEFKAGDGHRSELVPATAKSETGSGTIKKPSPGETGHLADISQSEGVYDSGEDSFAEDLERLRWPGVQPMRYEILGEFAHGGLGTILKVRDTRMDRVVAVKVLKRESAGALARFLREVMITGCLEHPGIIPVYEFGRWKDGRPFYSMKLVSGCTLSELIKKTKTLQGRLALLVHLIAVSDAMAYAHEKRIIHRDLKPGNVLVGSFGETVLIDWGLGSDLSKRTHHETDASTPYQVATAGLTSDGTVMGTAEYMPPEQAEGKAVDERADVYSLGAILYHVLTGSPPYRGNSSPEIVEKVTQAPPPPVEQCQPGVPKDLAAIVSKAMSRNAADRYSTAKEFAEELKRFQTGQLVIAHSYSTGALLRRWVGRHRMPVLLAAAFLLAFTMIGVASIRRIAQEQNAAQEARKASEQAKVLAEAQRFEADRCLSELTSMTQFFVHEFRETVKIRQVPRGFRTSTYLLVPKVPRTELSESP